MQNTENKQNITITGKRRVEIDNVDSISTLDNSGVILDTFYGDIAIEGDSIKIENFDKISKKASVIGEIKGVYYLEKTSKKKGRSIFG